MLLSFGRFRRTLLAAAALAALSTATGASAAVRPPASESGQAVLPGTHIVAVVNGDVISSADVSNRAKLFALSTGLPMAPDVLERLKPQIIRQLVDERLRIQEAQKRKIVVPDTQIAAAIREIEQRNNMPAGLLRQKLTADGVSQRTLIDQIRAQLGWTQVLRDRLGDKLAVSDSDVDAQQRIQAQQTGKPEYRVGEIFIPVDDPANVADARKFAETVIQELRAGAAFAVVAAQFSQSQTALAGGELGWVQPSQLDPDVARLVTEMPVGAVSNPVKVPGGFSVVTLQGKREIGRDIGTIVTLRQVFLPFSSPLNPQAPTEQQKQTLDKARGISSSVHSCEQMEQVAKANNSPRPADPGEVRLEVVTPVGFRQLLSTMAIGSSTQPLVASDGIAVATLCSREQKNLASTSAEDIRRTLMNDRVELLSRQLLRDLRRQANIDMRTGGV